MRESNSERSHRRRRRQTGATNAGAGVENPRFVVRGGGSVGAAAEIPVGVIGVVGELPHSAAQVRMAPATIAEWMTSGTPGSMRHTRWVTPSRSVTSDNGDVRIDVPAGGDIALNRFPDKRYDVPHRHSPAVRKDHSA